MNIDNLYNLLSLVIPEGYVMYKSSPASIYIHMPNHDVSSIISVLIKQDSEKIFTLISGDNQLKEYFSWFYGVFKIKLEEERPLPEYIHQRYSMTLVEALNEQ